MSTLDLNTVRSQIDEIDEEIQTLITKRAYLAEKVAEAKYVEEENPAFYRPERESIVLRQVIERNQKIRSPLQDDAIARIFREIMSACLTVQKQLSVAFLGPEGTYSQAAVLKHFGHSILTCSQQTIDDIFRAVESGNAQYGVVPVENSTEGAINQGLDCFISSPLRICGEVELPIHHNLLSKDKDFKEISRIYAHQQSLAQCRIWLDTHLPTAERIAVSSNAEAAKRATIKKHSAAIAGKAAADIYQLQIIVSHIENNVNNVTRFAILGKEDVPPTGCDKTSLLLSTSNEAGSLYRLLQIFAENGVSMTRIESRPSRQGIWEYVFFIDVEGHIEDTPVKNALETLKSHTTLFKHLGSYPRAVL
jgi:chorismate mutase/prephenate dehydratase